MRLRDRFGALLLDLDGTLYRGNDVIPGAPEALSGAAPEAVSGAAPEALSDGALEASSDPSPSALSGPVNDARSHCDAREAVPGSVGRRGPGSAQGAMSSSAASDRAAAGSAWDPMPAAGSAQALIYVTNNASRSAAAVAGHLAELGFVASDNDVVTSAQAAAHVLAERLPPEADVLIVGTDDLAEEIERVGLRPVRRFDERTPDAVVQGHSPQTGWPDLAEAAYAVRAGALWVAANTDTTLPNERGLAPGNGAMVAALRAATDREPIVAGKPYAPLLEDALTRAGTRAALVVGDRLDTDIDGAHCVGLPSLLVLTGVSTVAQLCAHPSDRLPTYVADSLDSLNHPVVEEDPVRIDGEAGDRLTELLRRHRGRAVAVIG